MANDKVHCIVCNIEITRKHYDRHFQSHKHIKNSDTKFTEFNELQNWANNNDIYNYGKLNNSNLQS